MFLEYRAQGMDIFKDPRDKVPRMTREEMGLEAFNKIFKKELDNFGVNTPNTAGTLTPHAGGIAMRPRSQAKGDQSAMLTSILTSNQESLDQMDRS